jgi:hypothetical protein
MQKYRRANPGCISVAKPGGRVKKEKRIEKDS